MRVSDSVSFSVYMNIFKRYFYIFQKVYKYLYFRREILLVFSAVIITGICGGKYYWYFRREILLVFSAGNITGIFGEKYYWYFRRCFRMRIGPCAPIRAT